MPAWTIEVWVRPTNFTQGYATIYSEGRWAASLGLNSGTGKLESWLNAGNQLIGSIALQLKTWNHVALTDDGDSRILYVNGVFAGAGNAPTVLPDTNGAAIGDVTSNPNSSDFPGQIDEVALYGRALDPAEVVSIYAAGLAGKTTVGPFFSTPPRLPNAPLGRVYSQTFTAVRGAAPLVYQLVGGALPAGLALSSDGVLSGTPTNLGSFSFTVRVSDGAGLAAVESCGLQVVAPLLPTAGLVAWWRAENDAQDAAGANNGVPRNGVAFAPGEVGQAFLLDGTSGFVEIPDAPALRPASITLEAWVMFAAADGIRVIFAKPIAAGLLYSYALWLENGSLAAGLGNASSLGPSLRVPFVPMPGRWYHLGYTFDDATRQQALYLNGAQVASGLGSGPIGYDAQRVHLGCNIRNGSPFYFFAGRIDEASIYNRALGAWELASVFEVGSAGKEPALSLPPLVLRSSLQGELLLVSFDVGVGKTYVLQYADTLNAGAWTLLTNITAVSTNVVCLDSSTNAPQRFYRVMTSEK